MRHDHDRPFDIEADEAADTSTQFWGSTRGWAPVDGGPSNDDSGWQARTTGSLQAIRKGFGGGRRQRPDVATGRLDRTRSHGIVRPAVADAPIEPVTAAERRRLEREATLGELASGWIDDNDWPDNWSAPTQRVAAVDRSRPASSQQPAVTAHASHAPPPPKRGTRHVEVELDADVAAHQTVRRTPVQTLTERLGVGAVDPLLIRLSAIVLIGVLFVPFAMAARSGGGSVGTEVAAAVPSGLPAGDPSASASPSIVVAPVPAPVPAPSTQTPQLNAAAVADPTSTVSATTPSTAATTPTTVTNTSASSTLAGALVEPAVAEEEAKRVEPVCALTYDAVVGDSWYRIADAAGITPRQLLDANLAMLDTPIFPGDEICLPEGASMPAPPTTTEAPTTTVATTVAPTTRAPSTTAAPTTTAPPVTAPPATTANAAQVQQMIRDIWPDELEQRALEIAYRESRYIATAFNGSCCYGVFQIYYTAHDGWLDEIGVNRASDLFDAQKNITAAYMIYQRAGGWGPWGG